EQSAKTTTKKKVKTTKTTTSESKSASESKPATEPTTATRSSETATGNDSVNSESKTDSPPPTRDAIIYPHPTTPSATESVEPAAKIAGPWSAELIYSPWDLIVPSKYGFSVDYIPGKTGFSFEFLRSSFGVPFYVTDLGKISDTRISALGRTFFGDSFNLSYGLSYMSIHVQLGDEYLKSISGGYYPGIEGLKLDTVGPAVGLGNRWIVADHVVIAVDWISYSQPLLILKREHPFTDKTGSEDQRSQVDRLLNVASYFPRITLAKIQVGWAF
ncbi:MAG: hypothetical protein V4736_08740, partial [Bdellovibrionota bacterium]